MIKKLIYNIYNIRILIISKNGGKGRKISKNNTY